MVLFRFDMLSQVSKYDNYFTQVLISCQLSNLKQHRILEQYIDILLLSIYIQCNIVKYECVIDIYSCIHDDIFQICFIVILI
jgi:hypothetical protein